MPGPRVAMVAVAGWRRGLVPSAAPSGRRSAAAVVMVGLARGAPAPCTRGSPPTLDEQLADAVRSLAAGMRAGLSVPQAIAFAATEGDAAARAHARHASSTASSLGAAPRRRARRSGRRTSAPTTPDWSSACWRCIGGAAAISRTCWTRSPTTLRERSEAAREVRALTAQARLSGAILGVLPIGFFAFLWMTSRGDIEGAFDSPIGIAAIASAWCSRASRSCGSAPSWRCA